MNAIDQFFLWFFFIFAIVALAFAIANWDTTNNPDAQNNFNGWITIAVLSTLALCVMFTLYTRRFE
jgi:hypothetical protein